MPLAPFFSLLNLDKFSLSIKKKKEKEKKKKMKGERFHPTVNEIKDIIKDGDTPVFRDEEGRIYGLVEDNGLKQDLIRSGELADNDLMWVWLTTHRSGPFAQKKRRFNAMDQIPIGEDLIFSPIGEKVDLYDYYSGDLVGDLMVISYPEQSYRKRRTDSVLVNLSFTITKKE